MGELAPVNMRLVMADGTYTYPSGFMENVLIRVEEYFVPDDFIIGDVKVDEEVPIILGRPFLATVGAVINVRKGRMTFDIGGEMLEFVMKDTDNSP